MATIVQSITANGIGTAPTATLGSTPTSGNTVIVLFPYNSTSVSTSLTPDTNIGTNFTVVINGQSGTMRLQEYYRVVGAGETTTYAATLDQSKDWGVVVMEVSGLTATPLDKVIDNTGTSGTPDSGTTLTTTQAAEYWLGLLVSRGTNSNLQTSPTNGFTQQFSFSTNSDLVIGVYDKTVSATGTANVSATDTDASQWHGAMATFKAVAGATAATDPAFYLKRPTWHPGNIKPLITEY